MRQNGNARQWRVEEVEQRFFGKTLEEAIENSGMSMNEVAGRSESTYEHLRKLVKSMAYPSKDMLRRLCKVLKLDFDNMSELVTLDKMQKQFGGNPIEMAGSHPRELELRTLGLRELSESDYNVVRAMVKSLNRSR